MRLFSRNRLPQHYPGHRRRDRELPVDDVILDGEVDLGRSRRRYHVFDILWLDGRDLMPLPLEERRALLDDAAAATRRCSASTRWTSRSRGSARAAKAGKA